MKSQISERSAWTMSGVVGLVIFLVLGGLFFHFLSQVQATNAGIYVFGMLLVVVTAVIFSSGFVIIQPMEARVIQFFGNYVRRRTNNGTCVDLAAEQ